MVISELIKELQFIEEAYGDKEIKIPPIYDGGGEINISKVRIVEFDDKIQFFVIE